MRRRVLTVRCVRRRHAGLELRRERQPPVSNVHLGIQIRPVGNIIRHHRDLEAHESGHRRAHRRNALSATKRGFTGHEGVDEIGFIHMYWRIYDPEIGKFFSPDPTMQFPESTQGFNRYAYAGNNPLTNVDPSGFSFFNSLMKVVGWLNVIATIFFPPLSVLGAAINGFIGGFFNHRWRLEIGTDCRTNSWVDVRDRHHNSKRQYDRHSEYRKKVLVELSRSAKFAKAVLEGVVGGIGSRLGGGRVKMAFLGPSRARFPVDSLTLLLTRRAQKSLPQ